MIAIRLKARMVMCALIVIAFCASTISCGGPGSAGTPNQNFATADEFFAGEFSGRVQIDNFQRATFNFTGTTIGTVDEGAILTIETNGDVPDGQFPQFQAQDYDLTGTFDQTNANFTLDGILRTSEDAATGLFARNVPVRIVGTGGGSFASGQRGSFTMTIEGNSFSGEVIRGQFE